MARVKDLTEVTLADLWREVKEEFWEYVNTQTLQLVKRLLENALEEELVSHLQVTWYQRNPDRQGYRNGYRKRDLFTRWGLLERLSFRGRTPRPGWEFPAQGGRALSAPPRRG